MPLTPTRASLVIAPVGRFVRANVAAATCSLACKDLNVDLVDNYATKNSAFHGEFDRVFLGQHVEAKITGAGNLSSGIAALLWNEFANLAMGYDLMTSTDVPAYIHTAEGGATIIASGLTSLPDLTLGPEEAAIGDFTVSGVVGTGLAATAASSLYTIGGNTTVVDSGLTSAGFIQQCYTAAFGAVSGFTAFEAEKSWKIRFNLKTKMHDVAGNIRKITYQGIEVLASCVPVGCTPAQLLTARGVSAATQIPGRAQLTVASALTITGTDTTTVFSMPKASVVSGGFRFGSEVLRQGEVGFYASRPEFSSGAQQALYSFTVA